MPFNASAFQDKIIAIVDDEIITSRELESELRFIQFRIDPEQLKAMSLKTLRKEALKAMIDRKLMLNLAKGHNIRITDSQVEEQLRSQVKYSKTNLETYLNYYMSKGLTPQLIKKNIKEELILAQVQRLELSKLSKISDEELNSFIHSPLMQQANRQSYHLKHILLPNQPALAEKLRQEIIAGANFEKLAKAYSLDDNKEQGGDLGYISEESLPTLFQNVIQNLAIGQISRPFQSNSGLHLLFLVDKKNENFYQKKYYNYELIILRGPSLIKLKNEDLNFLRDQVTKIRNDNTSMIIKGQKYSKIIQNQRLDDHDESSLRNVLAKMKPQELKLFSRSEHEIKLLFLTQIEYKNEPKKEFRDFAIQTLSQKKSQDKLMNWLNKLRSQAFIQYINE